MRSKTRFASVLGAGIIGLSLSLAAAPLPAAAQESELEYGAGFADDEAWDPFEPVNRAVFQFNRGVETVLLRPAAIAYRTVLPPFGRDMVRNFLNNLRAPVNAANALLQGDPERAGAALGRFSANTFIGLLGLFDVVPEVAQVNEDFGQTLAVWGVGEGPYLVLPFLGPSTVRDTAGFTVDGFGDPVNIIALNNGAEWVPVTRGVVRGIDALSRNLETLDDIERNAIDYYATLRSLYRQQRNDEIRNGEPGSMTPDISLRFDDETTVAQLSLLR